MASSYTTNKGLEQPANGDYVGNWNLPVNADWSTLDTCFGGVQVLNPTGLSGTVTLTSTTSGTQPYTRTTQWQSPNIVIGISATGQATLTNNVNYQLPSGIGGTWTIWNNTTGAYTVTFSSAGGGSSVVLPQGHRIQVVSDGTNIQVAQDSALNFTLNGFLRLNGATSGYVGFQASASNTSVMWTLPPGDGTSGQVMITNGAGVLSWYTLPVVSGYLPLTGGTLTGALSGTSAAFGSGTITSGSATYVGQSAVYVDSLVNGTTGQYRLFSFLSNGLYRWNLIADASVETGSNVGSNFTLSRYSDAGTFIDNTISISRATGVVTIQDGLIVSTGGCTVNGGFVATSGLQSVISGGANNGAVTFGTFANEVLDGNTANTLTINRAGYTYVASQGAWAHNGAFTNKGLVNNNGPLITGTYTLTTALSNSFVELAGSGAYTVTLPAPSTAGIEYRIFLNNASTITLSTPSGVIAGYGNAASSVGLSQGASTFYYLASDGSNWWLQAIAGYNFSNILSASSGLSINNTGGIFNTLNSGDLYFSGGTSSNQGAAIFLNGPSNGGNAQIYTGTGGTNALSMNFGPSGDAYFGGSFGPTSTVSVGYRGIPQSGGGYKGSNYTAVLSDAGSSIVTSTTGLTFTIPANASVAYPIGTTLTFVYGNGTGSLSIAINSDTLYLANTGGTAGARTLSPFGIATAIKVTSTVWIISGAGLA